jgi:arginine decarboxylase
LIWIKLPVRYPCQQQQKARSSQEGASDGQGSSRRRGRTNEGDIRGGFYAAYDAAGCEHIRLADPEIDRRLKDGPDLVSANFVIPYPPGFPIMVPGQVITRETIDFMRKLDVKEIHGYDAAEGLKLVRVEALAQPAKVTPKRAA